ncbi:double-strand break repair helicase AddA [Candidatus Liberibacter solanacearum CLso-ZC1]|uniref:DNA 3'-5' helicase n=1 Tax=Liberibacter solanacearum (strain CLso-ZC1) TaxID=658172 RepID=E4UCF7_LIBSC|nr:double-strand break repair helicase AddA [Candidatus Liberibacter solanacearum]ADR52047.1 double-strand break repair helicase AddA [Candidatus Liberibacter solanacearum CLso-ZC1]
MMHLNSSQNNSNITDWITWTKSQQLLASDPTRSAWVSANAGSGKTHILVQRVLRLLLSGANPSALLCLTHTKEAAAEMSHRVFEIITEWSHLSDEQLSVEITKIQGIKQNESDISKARLLLVKILETPNGLKVQTIHSFCESLIRQFPLESNITGDFSVLDGDQSKKPIEEAKKSTIASILLDDNVEFKQAFDDILNSYNDINLEDLMSDIISNRSALNRFSSFAKSYGGEEKLLKDRFDLPPNESYEKIYQDMWPLPHLRESDIKQYIFLATTKKMLKKANILKKLSQDHSIEERLNLLLSFFLTEEFKPYTHTTMMTASAAKKLPDLKEKIIKSQQEFILIWERLKTYKIFSTTLASLTLAKHLNFHYDKLKKKNFFLDFEDLIVYTVDLLKKRDISAWIRYKIDQEINHILIDEVQDTSLSQWEIIRSLTEDFFIGGNVYSNPRTLFAVGDEKQSIFSFHGAEPKRFFHEKTINKERIISAGQKFSTIQLPLSFRSTPEILAAVDKVFSTSENAQGLTEDKQQILHRSNRIGHAGNVQLWEKVISKPNPKQEDWISCFDSVPEETSASILARRIAYTISKMIRSDTIINNGKKRPVHAKDILILVRKRKNNPFIAFLTRFLINDHKISVASNDRFVLTDHLAIKDLMALGNFIISQEDDLSLVSLLKSPIFNLSENDIFEICTKRHETETIYAYIQKLANHGISKCCHIVQYMQELICIYQSCSPYDFFTLILGAKEGRKQFISRFGIEVVDVLNEFLNFTLRNEQKNCSTLQELMSDLEHYPPTLKKESVNRNEVRIMTVHSAKGLESPVVFLVDTGSEVFSSNHIKKIHISPSSDDCPGTPIWIPQQFLRNKIVSDLIQDLKKSAQEENNRLLYVGMTRASDKLIICSHSNASNENKSNQRTWYNMVYESFYEDTQVKEVKLKNPTNKDEWLAYEWCLPNTENIQVEEEAITAPSNREEKIPEKLFAPIKNEMETSYVLNPSMLNLKDKAIPEKLLPDNTCLKRGQIIHQLLQVIFTLPEEKRDPYILSYCKKNANFLSVEEDNNLLISIKALLKDPIMSTAMSSDSYAEVSVSGKIHLSKKDVLISGRIDQIAISQKNVFIFEYKTHPLLPKGIEYIPSSHITQLAIYEKVLKNLYPDKSIICLLIYISGPKIFMIPQEKLDQSFMEIEDKIS